jgi:hypothetical protein
VGQYDRKLTLQCLPKLTITDESSPSILSGISSWGKLYLSQHEDTELNKHLPRRSQHHPARLGGQRHRGRSRPRCRTPMWTSSSETRTLGLP